jgi:bacterioferritin-associated ferredoxin
MGCDGLPSLNPGETYVCACLKLTQADLVRAIQCLGIRTLKDLRNQTGAGDGCMACQRRLRCYVEGDRSALDTDIRPDVTRVAP